MNHKKLTTQMINLNAAMITVIDEHESMVSYLEEQELIRLDEETGESWYWVASGEQVSEGH